MGSVGALSSRKVATGKNWASSEDATGKTPGVGGETESHGVGDDGGGCLAQSPELGSA